MLTPEQINQIRAKSGLAPLTQTNNAKSSLVGKYDYLKQPTQEKGFVDNVKESASKRLGDAKQALSGDVNPLSAGLQFWGAGAGMINEVIGAGINKVAPIIPETIGKVASKVINTEPAQKFISSYQDFKAKHPEAAKDLESATNILSLLPTGKAVEVGTNAVKTGAEITGNVVKSTLSNSGKVLEKAGEKIFTPAIPLSKSEAGLVQTYRAKNPLLQRLFQPIAEKPRTAAITALDKGFVGSEQMIGVQANKEAVNLWKNTIAPAVRSITQKYDIQGAIKSIESKVATISEQSRKKSLLEAVQSLKEDYKGVSSISFEKAQEIKSQLAKFIPEKAYQGKPIGSSFKEVQNLLADDIRQKTYNVLSDVNIKSDYLDYGNLLKLQEFGQKAMTGAKSKAGFGSFITNLYDTATVPIRTVIGQGLNKGGKILQKIK